MLLPAVVAAAGERTASRPESIPAPSEAARTLDSSDRSQIEAWWGKWPSANIGIATGAVSGIVVLDIDGAEGWATLQELIAEHGFLPRTPVVKTARGWHLYFKLPQGVAIRRSPRASLA